jgi:flagellar assembly factor FliW
MELETRRFGTIEVDDDEIYGVPTGIPGFPALHRVTLLGAGPFDPNAPDGSSEHSLFWIQDLDDGDLAFLCVVPWVAFPDYEIDIDEKSLGIDDEADVRVLSLLTTRREDGAATMTANLRAPLVVDVRRRRLQQVILSDSRWPIRAPFAVLQASEVG